MDSCRTSSVILRIKSSAGKSIEQQRDRAHTLEQLAQPWRRLPPLATREQMDLLVRASVRSGSRQQIADKEEHRQREQNQWRRTRHATSDENKGCTGGRWVVESRTVLEGNCLITDETAAARWWNTSTMARADTCPFVQLQPSCCMISTKQLAKSGIPGRFALEARAWKLGALCWGGRPLSGSQCRAVRAAGGSWCPRKLGPSCGRHAQAHYLHSSSLGT